MKRLLCLTALFACLNVPGQCFTANTTILYITNQRNCDVTVNYEVSDCGGAYCNSYAQFNTVPNTTFVIPAGGTFTVDIQAQFCMSCPMLSPRDCRFYTAGSPYDLFVGLFELDYNPPPGGGIWGGISGGCGIPCFSTAAPTSGANGAGSCSNFWSMTWVNNVSGVLVTIQ